MHICHKAKAVLQHGALSLWYRFGLVPPRVTGQFAKVWNHKKKITLHPVIVTELSQRHLWHSRKAEVAQGPNYPHSPPAACMLCSCKSHPAWVQKEIFIFKRPSPYQIIWDSCVFWYQVQWEQEKVSIKSFWLKHLPFYSSFQIPVAFSSPPPFLHPFKDGICAKCSSLYLSGIAPI